MTSVGINIKILGDLLANNNNNLDVTYGFEQADQTTQKNEYIVFFEISEPTNLSNDNNYLVKHQTFQISLYSEKRNPAYEDDIETLFQNNDIRFIKPSINYIDSEKIFQTIYEVKLSRINNNNI